MATKHVTLTGKAEWCKPWDFQLDTAFVDNTKGPDPRGGNFATVVILDDASVAAFTTLGTKAKLKDGNKLTVRRYERHPVLGELGPVEVSGVEQGVLIGNGSDITIDVDVYDYTYLGRPSRGVRWVGVHVDALVVYEAPATSKPAVGVPVI